MHNFYIPGNVSGKYTYYYLDSNRSWQSKTFSVKLEEMDSDIVSDASEMEIDLYNVAPSQYEDSLRFTRTLNNTFLASFYNIKDSDNKEMINAIDAICMNEDICSINEYIDRIEFRLFDFKKFGNHSKELSELKHDLMADKYKIKDLLKDPKTKIREYYNLDELFPKITSDQQNGKYYKIIIYNYFMKKSSGFFCNPRYYDTPPRYIFEDAYTPSNDNKYKEIAYFAITKIRNFIQTYTNILNTTYLERSVVCPKCFNRIRQLPVIKTEGLVVNIVDKDIYPSIKECPSCSNRNEQLSMSFKGDDTIYGNKFIVMDDPMIEVCKKINKMFYMYAGQNITKFSCSGHFLEDHPYIAVKNIELYKILFDDNASHEFEPMPKKTYLTTLYEELKSKNNSLFEISYQELSNTIGIYYNKTFAFYDMLAIYGDLKIVTEKICNKFVNLLTLDSNKYVIRYEVKDTNE